MEYRLISAVPADKPWLEALRRGVYKDLFVATWGGWDETRHFRHCAACWEQGDISIIEIDGERVGMIQLIERAESIEVGEIQIQPLHQGQGIGSRLLQDVLARARAQGKKVLLATGLQNRRAVRLYERLGFRHVFKTETHFHMEVDPGA
jgi:ribosomal protein S18 acetylase RimI-like enzyme